LAIGLAQLLTKSFINPLLKLHEGALAIENRNFKYRLSIPNVDEFGEVSGIFNHMMVGLQELEIAKIIQESMFPKPEFNQGKFSVYGKSVTMIDVGGDYLDFFKVDDNNFAVLLGDVAGHGVAAAVIMAMAKATILVSGNYLHSPSAILNELHKTILSVKSSKQKKFMTFQYMLVNSETGENLYSNAGGCSPCLVRPTSKSLIELEKYEPVLGGFKNTIYSETSFEFVPGDAIVFFTDGIVECKNKKGEILGYKKLKDIFLACYDSNPKTYYENIYKAYLDYTGMGSEPEDDLTIIVLSYSKFDNDELGNKNSTSNLTI
jgi:sigma-B regulation protein RsbU (phosphoserine phosphatase)